jgi:hypothetical protein
MERISVGAVVEIRNSTALPITPYMPIGATLRNASITSLPDC